MKKTQKLLFIGEGQTEDALVGNLFQGKVKIFNLAHNSISKIIRTIPKPNEVSIFLMIDTDILIDAKKLACLIQNIEYLKRMKYSISILQQKDDLEEELAKQGEDLTTKEKVSLIIQKRFKKQNHQNSDIKYFSRIFYRVCLKIHIFISFLMKNGYLCKRFVT